MLGFIIGVTLMFWIGVLFGGPEKPQESPWEYAVRKQKEADDANRK